MAVQRGEQYVMAFGSWPPEFTLALLAVSGGVQVVECDVLIGIENVTGSNHAETITGNERDNVLDGRGGSDIIDGGFGNDVMIGNGGTDTASFLSHDGLAADGSPDVISLGNGTSDGSYTRFQALGPIRQAVETDVLRGIENVTGSDSDEIISGNDGANVLDGRGGNDTIDGGLGNDAIIGGGGVLPGIDTVSYEKSRRGCGRVRGGRHFARAERGRWQLYAARNCINYHPAIGPSTDVRGIEKVSGSNRIEMIRQRAG